MSYTWERFELLNNNIGVNFDDIIDRFKYVHTIPDFYFIEIDNNKYINVGSDLYYHQISNSQKWKPIRYDQLPEEAKKATIKDKI